MILQDSCEVFVFLSRSSKKVSYSIKWPSCFVVKGLTNWHQIVSLNGVRAKATNLCEISWEQALHIDTSCSSVKDMTRRLLPQSVTTFRTASSRLLWHWLSPAGDRLTGLLRSGHLPSRKVLKVKTCRMSLPRSYVLSQTPSRSMSPEKVLPTT